MNYETMLLLIPLVMPLVLCLMLQARRLDIPVDTTPSLESLQQLVSEAPESNQT